MSLKRKKSLKDTAMRSIINKKNPTKFILLSIFGGILFLVILSMPIKTSLPPSKAGKGRIFTMAKAKESKEQERETS